MTTHSEDPWSHIEQAETLLAMVEPSRTEQLPADAQLLSAAHVHAILALAIATAKGLPLVAR